MKSGTEVTDDVIHAALKDAPFMTDQGAVSVPAVRRYVELLAHGDVAPPIKVQGGVLVERNHGYVARRV